MSTITAPTARVDLAIASATAALGLPSATARIKTLTAEGALT